MREIQDRTGLSLRVDGLEMTSTFEGWLEMAHSRFDAFNRMKVDDIRRKVAPRTCLIFGGEGMEVTRGYRLVGEETWIARLSAPWDRSGTEHFDVQKSELVIAWFQLSSANPFEVLAAHAADLDWSAHADSASYDV